MSGTTEPEALARHVKPWLVCAPCGAGPFVEWSKAFTMHWYDYGHTTYRVVPPPPDGVEGGWDQPSRQWLNRLAAREEQRRFDMAEPS